jgi:imidazolonepropionase-like amidohydrolase
LAPLALPAPLAPLALSLLGHEIGAEETTLSTDNGTRILTSRFSYLDRAANVELKSTLRIASDFTPLAFESHGRTYRLFPVDVSVPKASGAANTFTLEGMAPIAAQGLLIQYWLKHGKPATITLEPSGDAVTIKEEPDTERGLRHFTIDGVVWGREDIWLDGTDFHVAMALTTAGVMAFEAYDPAFAGVASSWRKTTTAARFSAIRNDQRSVVPRAQGTFALVGARLIDGTGKAPIDDAVVVVRNNRIERAGPRVTTPVPPGVVRVDVSGKTVLPGLWDMHAHVGQPEWGPVYLASGVTTIRDMGGEFDVVTALRDAWGQQLIGPRLLAAGLVDGPGPGSFGHVTAATPDEGRQAVARYKAAGFQQMKLYSLLDRPTSQAVIDAAHAAGMTVTGHIPNGLSMREIVEMGMDNVAHLTVRDAPGSDALRDTIAFLKAHKTVIDPTLSWNELLGRSPTTSIASFIPRVEHVAPPLRRMLDAANGGNVAPDQARERLSRSLQIVKALHDAGVPIVPGTDKGVPGVSLAREIELYVMAGMTPMDAIRAGTAISAQVMGVANDTGTLVPGLRADLIVVDGNPLERIADLEKVTMVAAAGRLYDTASLWRAGGFR